jgi:hypothetical protein
MRLLILFSILTSLISCEVQINGVQGNTKNQVSNYIKMKTIDIDTASSTLSMRFSTPTGFERIPLDTFSFGSYLRELPLKPYGSKVNYYDGRVKTKENVYCAVVDQAIDPVDLQQCADAVMRLRAEYLFQQKRYDLIHFNFVSDNKPRYYKDYAKGDYSYKKFRAYMKYVFSYANTASLKNELKKVNDFKDILPGDVLIQSGSPYGHAVIVVDVAIDNNGKKLFMIAQSYMPAQETQILINPNNRNLTPWYSTEIESILTPEWRFEKSDLRRFTEN